MTESVTPVRYAKKVFYIEAVRVTLTNMEQVAEWCGGVVQHTRAKPEKDYPASPYVKVNVHNPRTVRQTRAFVGDWVVKAENNVWRTYPHKAFCLAFEPVANHPSTFVTS